MRVRDDQTKQEEKLRVLETMTREAKFMEQSAILSKKEYTEMWIAYALSVSD